MKYFRHRDNNGLVEFFDALKKNDVVELEVIYRNGLKVETYAVKRKSEVLSSRTALGRWDGERHGKIILTQKNVESPKKAFLYKDFYRDGEVTFWSASPLGKTDHEIVNFKLKEENN